MKRFLRWAHGQFTRFDCFIGAHRKGALVAMEVNDWDYRWGRNFYRCVHCGAEIVEHR